MKLNVTVSVAKVNKQDTDVTYSKLIRRFAGNFSTTFNTIIWCFLSQTLEYFFVDLIFYFR